MVISKNTNLFHFGVVLFHSCLVCMAMASSNFTDLSALLAFKSELDSNNSLVHNWTTTADFCSWIGVSCSKRRQRVTALILPEMDLTGTISPLIGNLSFLSFIDLGINNLYGNLPNEFSRLHRLEVLILDYNQLEGAIPPSLQLCQMLQVMSLAHNKFSGVIPRELGNLPVLRTLYLIANNLEEPLPSTLSNISTLQYLSLGGMGLTGPFPSVIFNMSSLLSLILPYNSISGNFPESFCHYFPRLQKLDVAHNQLSGQLPPSLSQCVELQELYMLFNNFTGSIPEGMGSMSKLKTLYLANNSFTGEIPPSLGNISGLEKLWLGSNYLQGNIPGIFGLSTNFIEFLLEGNSLTGVIPPNIFNISSLQVINLLSNNFSGSLPSGTTFSPNLQRLFMNGNKLSGNIPQFLSNSTRLLAIDLGYNMFTGPIPTSLGNLRQLQFLHLDGNFLTGDVEGLELQFITALTNCKFLERLILESNPLNGILPNSIGNFSDSFQIFYAPGCQLKGRIPDGIGSLQNLNMFALSNNDINGTIPTTIGGMERLQRLYFDGNNIEGVIPTELCHMQNLGEVSLQSNRLSGPIPSCIGNLGSLQMLFLSSNNLTSSIPMSLWGLGNLLFLNLSFNSLNGRLPLDMRMLSVMANLDISHNQINGDIPNIIGSFKSLSSLNLSANSFQGSIPSSLGNLVTLEFLDLSQNNLSGNIPMSLEALLHLRYLNLSFNKLSGKIPSGGAFENFTVQSFMENEALCGKPSLQVCKPERVEKSRTKRVLFKFILPAVAFVLIAAGFIFMLRYCRAGKKQKDQSSFDLVPGKAPRMISYHELRHATNNFCESNLLGKGGSGSVYKALLSDGTEVAVKIFNLQQERAFKSFDVECEVLRNVRHRNLVKVISSCSHPELRALVLQYMCNGSLEKWLYSHNNCLDLLQRVSIMVDVATALEYLHHGQSEPIVHCDLKPSNILLDDDMVAHVADFGIAKILAENNTSANTKTIGTIGYVAPEYGSEGRVSTKGDIYSYGILLLETFTRRKPTDEMFFEELTLRKWVNESVPKMVMEIVDDGLLRTDGGKVNEIRGQLQAIMEVGLACSEELPENRGDIKDVVVTLNKIKLHLVDDECEVRHRNLVNGISSCSNAELRAL